MLFRQTPRESPTPVTPNAQTYASLLHALAQAGQLKVGMSICVEYRKSTRIISTNTITVENAESAEKCGVRHHANA